MDSDAFDDTLDDVRRCTFCPVDLFLRSPLSIVIESFKVLVVLARRILHRSTTMNKSWPTTGTAGAWIGWRGSTNLDRIDYDPATGFWSPESGPEFLAAHWFGIAKPFEAVPGSILKIGFLYSMNGIQWCALSRPGNCRHLNVITSNFRSFYAASPDVPGRDSPAKLEIELWDLKMKPIGPSLDQTRPSCGCLANSNN